MAEIGIDEHFADAPFDVYYRALRQQPSPTDLLPDEVRNQLPRLQEQQHEGGAATVYLHLLGGDDTVWYITEFDGHDALFGFVHALVGKWTYVSLSALQTMGAFVVRDMEFVPTPLWAALAADGISLD